MSRILVATKKFWTQPPITMLICVFVLMFLYFIMARQPLLDSPLKNRFIGSIQAGKSIRQAAKDHNIAPVTANDIYHKYNKTGTTRRRAVQVPWLLKLNVISSTLLSSFDGCLLGSLGNWWSPKSLPAQFRGFSMQQGIIDRRHGR